MRHLLRATAAAVLMLGSAQPAVGQSEPTGTTGTAPAGGVRFDVPPPEPPPPPSISTFEQPQGRCLAKVTVAGATETHRVRVLVSPERKESRVIPARYAEVEERVLVTPERVVRTPVPATWRTVTETVVVVPGRTRTETIPPQYDIVRELVEAPGVLEWRPARALTAPPPSDPARMRYGPGGEPWFLVEGPPVRRWVERRVLVRAARTAEFRDPPVTRQVTRQVIDQPARVDERPVPAVYRTEKRRKLIEPERTETVTIPARWREVEQTRAAPVNDWRPAPCAREVTPALVRRVQRALNGRGYSVGLADGSWGAGTAEALARFQRDRGLATGALTIETLRALNIEG